MTQEEKTKLLLKDLSARLIYGVKYRFTDKDSPDFELSDLSSIMKYWIEEGKVLPYLRPMSSMTEEELYEWTHTWIMDNTIEKYDWLNKKHFDYRGLIPMGLALEAPEGMYNTKTE